MISEYNYTMVLERSMIALYNGIQRVNISKKYLEPDGQQLDQSSRYDNFLLLKLGLFGIEFPHSLAPGVSE